MYSELNNVNEGDFILKKVLCEEYPTDIGHYLNVINEAYVKLFIIRYEACPPPGPFPITNIFGVSRSFSIFLQCKI